MSAAYGLQQISYAGKRGYVSIEVGVEAHGAMPFSAVEGRS